MKIVLRILMLPIAVYVAISFFLMGVLLVPALICSWINLEP